VDELPKCWAALVPPTSTMGLGSSPINQVLPVRAIGLSSVCFSALSSCQPACQPACLMLTSSRICLSKDNSALKRHTSLRALSTNTHPNRRDWRQHDRMRMGRHRRGRNLASRIKADKTPEAPLHSRSSRSSSLSLGGNELAPARGM